MLHDSNFGKRDLRIWIVDERFIVAKDYLFKSDTLSFISTEILEELRTSSLLKCDYEYDQGLLFQIRVKRIVRILDVVSGTHSNDVRLPIREEDLFNCWIRGHLQTRNLSSSSGLIRQYL
jgi:hypothetical protein